MKGDTILQISDCIENASRLQDNVNKPYHSFICLCLVQRFTYYNYYKVAFIWLHKRNLWVINVWYHMFRIVLISFYNVYHHKLFLMFISTFHFVAMKAQKIKRVFGSVTLTFLRLQVSYILHTFLIHYPSHYFDNNLQNTKDTLS